MSVGIFATQLFSMTRTVVNVAFRVEKRRGMVHGFLFDVFALAVAGLLAEVVAGHHDDVDPFDFIKDGVDHPDAGGVFDLNQDHDVVVGVGGVAGPET